MRIETIPTPAYVLDEGKLIKNLKILRQVQEDGSKHPFDQFILSKTPAGRWGEPEDLMGPAVFLASDASNFVNGQILYVDGGILAYIGKQPQG